MIFVLECMVPVCSHRPAAEVFGIQQWVLRARAQIARRGLQWLATHPASLGFETAFLLRWAEPRMGVTSLANRVASLGMTLYWAKQL